MVVKAAMRGEQRETGRPRSLISWIMLLLTAAVVFNVSRQQSNGLATSDALKPLEEKQDNKNNNDHQAYKPSFVENYFLDHAHELGYFKEEGPMAGPAGCTVWKDPNASRPIYDTLMTYRKEVQDYQARVTDFQHNVKDLRLHLDDEPNICDSLELHEDGMEGIFPSGALSHGSAGYIEPLFPPLRDPEFCFDSSKLMSLDYIVHDFAAMCRKLKRTSRTIFVDMGASLDFHSDGVQPAVYVTKLYEKFGFHFDHIYAYEMRGKKPSDVFDRVPPELMAAYHWINVGVSEDPDSKLNPLKMLLENYNEDDFVVIKLDIDTSSIEVPLAFQILEDARLSKLVDSFYFEHHVHLKELARNWGSSMHGTIGESMKLFRGMRERGISAHYWV
jgi:hypothetical protein